MKATMNARQSSMKNMQTPSPHLFIVSPLEPIISFNEYDTTSIRHETKSTTSWYLIRNVDEFLLNVLSKIKIIKTDPLAREPTPPVMMARKAKKL